MSTDSKPAFTNVVPYLAYDDPAAALEFLCHAFGGRETERFTMPDGRIGHAQVVLGEQTVMLASAFPELGLSSPAKLGGVHCQLFCFVDDVDAHFERAKAAGATLLTQPEDQDYGDRMYRAADPEGHRWVFSARSAASAT